MRLRKPKITESVLLESGSCAEESELFGRLFPNGINVKKISTAQIEIIAREFGAIDVRAALLKLASKFFNRQRSSVYAYKEGQIVADYVTSPYMTEAQVIEMLISLFKEMW